MQLYIATQYYAFILLLFSRFFRAEIDPSLFHLEFRANYLKVDRIVIVAR